MVIRSNARYPICLPGCFSRSFFVRAVPRERLQLNAHICLREPAALFRVSLNPSLSNGHPVVHPNRGLAQRLVETVQGRVRVRRRVASYPVTFPFRLSGTSSLLLGLGSRRQASLTDDVAAVFRRGSFIFRVVSGQAVRIRARHGQVDLPLFGVRGVLPRPVLTTYGRRRGACG